MKSALILVLLAGFLGQSGPEERIDDNEFEKVAAIHVKALEAVEKTWRKDAAQALKAMEPVLQAIEADLVPKAGRLVESVIAVRATRGIDKGEIKERRPFFPYRLAGEIALAAGEPDRAVAYLQKSPSGAALLAEAKKAAEAKKDPAAPPAPPPPARPAVDLKAYFERRDFTGALDAIRAQRAELGEDADRLAREVRAESVSLQKTTLALLAGLLPRLGQEAFRKEHLAPCLQACAKVPVDAETEELRWARRLDRWLDRRDPAEFERLAVDAARFGGDFVVLCDRAQDERLLEIEKLVGAVQQSTRADRAPLLDRLGAAERALGELSAARPRPESAARLASLKAGLPIDDKALDEARGGSGAIADIRRLADELDRLWVSDRRARLSLPDQKDLGLQLGVYRCMALFLDGKTIEEAARDVRLLELFRSSGELPPDVSPKVAAVRARIRR
jgi:hypothetical protein